MSNDDLRRSGATTEQFAEVVVKNQHNGARNPRAQYGSELTVDNALWMGADGVVPGLGNVDPHGYVKLFDHAAAGEWEQAEGVALPEGGEGRTAGLGWSILGHGVQGPRRERDRWR